MPVHSAINPLKLHVPCVLQSVRGIGKGSDFVKQCWKECVNPDNNRKFYTMNWIPYVDREQEILSLTQDSEDPNRWWYASDIHSFGDFVADSLYAAMRVCEEMHYDYLYKKQKFWEDQLDQWESIIYD